MESLIVWRDEYSVAHDGIDEQRRRIIGIIEYVAGVFGRADEKE